MRYILQLQKPTGGTSGVLSVSKVESDYYGNLFITAVKSGASSDASGYVYAGKDARTHAINKNTGMAAATITIPDGTAEVDTSVTNVSGKGPDLANVDIHCYADGTFTDAVIAFTDAPNYEILRRMEATLGQKYAAANEPLRDGWGFKKADIERGLLETMQPRSYPRLGVAQLFEPAYDQTTGQHQMTHPIYQWTAWIFDYASPEAAHDAASQLMGTLYCIAFEEQRNWGGGTARLALNTVPVGRPSMKPFKDDARYGYQVIIQMQVDTDLGQSTTMQFDPSSTVHGGRYASVTLEV